MQREFSVYLDGMRFFAAALVFLTHSYLIYPVDSLLFKVGHEAVIIFFVLSGFVIAYVADTKESTLRDYALSRFARIYSVALPAVLLTVSADYIGQSHNLASYPHDYIANDFWIVRFLSSLAFTNELWLVSIQSFSNVPYWSLNYEVWYYVGFACVTFFPRRTGWLLFAGAALIAGPKIAMLAPIWWLGVWCYRTRLSARLSPGLAWGVVALSIAGVASYFHFNLNGQGSRLLASWVGDDLHTNLAFSNRAIGDYYLAVFVAAHFVGMRKLAPSLGRVTAVVERPVRWLAGFTFILYLSHQPLLLFYSSVLNAKKGDLADFLLVAGLTLLTVVVVGSFTERRKGLVKRWAAAALDAVEARLPRLNPARRAVAATKMIDEGENRL